MKLFETVSLLSIHFNKESTPARGAFFVRKGIAGLEPI
jgi:hypothetical protein